MVEQEAVNFEVAGSSPAPGAMNKKMTRRVMFLFIVVPVGQARTSNAGSASEETSEKEKLAFLFPRRRCERSHSRSEWLTPGPGSQRSSIDIVRSVLRYAYNPDNNYFLFFTIHGI